MRPFAVAASRVRFEEKQIFEALDRRGVRSTHIDPRSFWDGAIERKGAAPRDDYAAVLDREIAQTRGLYLARLLEAAGVRVLNSARASETCADKIRSTLALRAHGLPLPRTAAALTPDAARAAARELGFPLVVKAITGSWGRMVSLVQNPDALDAILEHREAMPSPQQRVVYLQELVDKPGRDIRVVVVGGRPLGAIYRVSPSFRTNAARGAETMPCPLSPELARLAACAAAAVDADVAGVDLVEDREGRLLVLEVNHVVEFRGFAAAHGDRIDVAGAIADHLVAPADAEVRT